jgi:hypothetical protein
LNTFQFSKATASAPCMGSMSSPAGRLRKLLENFHNNYCTDGESFHHGFSFITSKFELDVHYS